MALPVQRLKASDRPQLREHFLALGPEDVRLRFGSAMRPEALVAYVDRIDFEHDAAFGVHSDALKLIGVVHLAFSMEIAELGVSVLDGHRGSGIGSALVSRAAAHARNRFYGRLFMHCLAENSAMMHIARKAGMAICIDTGEAEAFVKLPPADAASVASEFVDQRIALFDYALKTHVAATKRLAAMEAANKAATVAKA